jgi:hypothetical protein
MTKKSTLAIIPAVFLAAGAFMGCSNPASPTPGPNPGPGPVIPPEYDHELNTLAGAGLNITPASIRITKPVGQPVVSDSITAARTGLTAQSEQLQNNPRVGALEADINNNYANFGGSGVDVITRVKGAHDEIANVLGNGAILSAYRNAKYIGQRSDMGQVDFNDVLQGLQGVKSVCAQYGITVPAIGNKVKTEDGIKNITTEIQALIMALEDRLVNTPEIANIEGGLDLVQQLGDFAKFAGWTDAVLATPNMYPCHNDFNAAKLRTEWEATGSQFVGLPVPNLGMQSQQSRKALAEAEGIVL